MISSSVSLQEPVRVDSGLRLFPVPSFRSCTYISSDARWCDPRTQVYFLDIGGLTHPVIDIHALFSSGTSLEACVDLAQTGYAYSVEK